MFFFFQLNIYVIRVVIQFSNLDSLRESVNYFFWVLYFFIFIVIFYIDDAIFLYISIPFFT